MPRLLIILLLLNGLFIALRLPDAGAFPWFAVESAALVGAYVLLRDTVATRALAWVLGIGYGLLTLCSVADVLIRESFGRPLNLYLDAGLVDKAFNLVSTNLGGLAAVLAGLFAIAWVAGAAWLVRSLLLAARRAATSSRQGWAIAGLSAAGLGLMLFSQAPVTAGGGEFVARQVSLAQHTAATTRDFDQAVRRSGAGAVALPGLGSEDVLLGFIESYGISALSDPRYRDRLSHRLAVMEQALYQAGLHVVTGRLRSPVQGGQSWLARATVLSGLWVDSQLDYEILLASDYTTLVDDFRQTGHDTVAVMPAITQAWPEGKQLRYGRVYGAAQMDYAGPSLNWVTMPDQYTWSWFEHRVRAKAEKPLFAEMALISSHAPWVPILPVLDDWQSIGQGEVFERWRDAGEAPASLWQDPARVRQHYIRSIDYALEVVTGYAVRNIDARTLLVVLGDHQAAPLVTGENASRDVPVHIIARDPALLAPFTGEGGPAGSGLPGFQRGTRPAMTPDAVGMDQLRPFLHRHFQRRYR